MPEMRRWTLARNPLPGVPVTHPADKEAERLKPLRRFTAADFAEEVRRRLERLKAFNLSLPEDLLPRGQTVEINLWLAATEEDRCMIRISSGGAIHPHPHEVMP